MHPYSSRAFSNKSNSTAGDAWFMRFQLDKPKQTTSLNRWIANTS
jgi:hypothetical protein